MPTQVAAVSPHFQVAQTDLTPRMLKVRCEMEGSFVTDAAEASFHPAVRAGTRHSSAKWVATRPGLLATTHCKRGPCVYRNNTKQDLLCQGQQALYIFNLGA